VPFESSAQQFGWNGDYPNGPVDCTGRELVARMRLLSGFVEDPESAPGGVLMYLFSDEWSNSVAAWNNVPAPSEEWFEVTVGCEASADSTFNPALVNGIGFTFNSGGEDASSYAASSAMFEVDQLCWRGTTPTGVGGAGGAGGGTGGEATGGGGASAVMGGMPPQGGMGGMSGGSGGMPGGSGGMSAGAGGMPGGSGGMSGGSGGMPGGSGGMSAGAGGMSGGMGGMAGSGGMAGGGTGGMGPDDCEILVSFDQNFGVVATDGGTDPVEWETDVVPTISGGVFNVLVPFSPRSACDR